MKKYLFISAILLFLLIAGGVGSAVLVYMWASQDLPGFTRITDYQPPLVTTVYARDDRVLGYFYREKRFLAKLDEMPEHLPKAFLAAEDSNFYEHQGVDPVAILRAGLRNVMAGGTKQGASTITQQLIKSLLLTPERSYTRKIKEAILSYRLERYLTKDEILTIYLNQIYLGSGAYGVEAAARTYFGKHIQNLTLAQSAVLAGLPKAPTRYSPFHDAEAARGRQRYVLGRMLEMGWITPREHEAALAEPLVFSSMPDPTWTQGAYYLEEVRRQLVEKFGEDAVYSGGLQVRSAVDLTHQAAAERSLRAGLIASAKRHGWTGPIKNVPVEEWSTFLQAEAVPPELLEQGTWVKALVENVDERSAKVRFGDQVGTIDVSTMRWARTPNLRVTSEEAPKIGDARKVLKRGDAVWASIVSAPGAATTEKAESVAKPDKGKADKKAAALALAEKLEKGDKPDKADKPEKKSAGWQLALEVEPQVEGALVSIEPDTGDVRALVGGYSFARSQFNRATQAKRQPGSSFKPIVYSAAMDAGLTPASIILDAPFVYTDPHTDKVWKPENFEENFFGPMLLRTALAKSRNLVTIRVAQRIGIKRVIERARALGLEANFQPVLSMSLGSIEVTPLNLCQAYTAFARTDGAYVKPRLVTSVKSAWGDDLFTSKIEPVPAISPQNAFIMASLLQEVVRDGTATRAKALGRPVGGKTGTTNNEQDAWFMGFTPYLLTGVYVGYDQVQPMGKFETGGKVSCPIWLAYRQAIESEYPPQDFAMPEGVVMARVDDNGMLASATAAKGYNLPFLNGTQPVMTAAQVAAEQSGVSAETAATGEDLLKQVF